MVLDMGMVLHCSYDCKALVKGREPGASGMSFQQQKLSEHILSILHDELSVEQGWHQGSIILKGRSELLNPGESL
jgi:hypothetical protein